MPGAAPMRGGAAAIEQAGLGKDVGAGADAGETDAASCHGPHEVKRLLAPRDGFDPLVFPLSPYEEEDAAALARAAGALREAGAGLVVMDCMGFRRKTRNELRALTGVPVLLANLLVARVIAELAGA